MITAILIDDEENALKVLALELKHFSARISVREQFTKTEEAITYLSQQDVDVVFLDIDMPGMNGIDFLNCFPDRNFHVVYTTAHSKYAINAVRTEAVDFLLKPIDSAELSDAIGRLEQLEQKESFENKLSRALDKINELEGRQKRIKLSYEGKLIFFDPDDILYCKGEGNYSYVYLENDEKLLFSFQLKLLEELLPAQYFFRIHNSYIVNLSKIKSFHKNDRVIELKNKQQLPVSKQKKIDVIDRL